jgi:TolB-like protein
MSRYSRRPAQLIAIGLLGVIAIGSSGCIKQQVTRIDPNAVTDLSGRWNDTDSRLVANALIYQSLESPWALRYSEVHGGDAPTIIVGEFRNKTMEHIPVSTFLLDLENAFVNSGSVRVVASSTEREEIRGERDDQQRFARAGTRAALGQELGANYILQGEIAAIEDEEARERIIYYQVNAALIDLETNEKTWVGQYEIKKYIERDPWIL